MKDTNGEEMNIDAERQGIQREQLKENSGRKMKR
jgi:hypothetical protein